MAGNNISNRISLDGGDDLRKQALAIGDAFDQVFQGVKNLADALGKIDFAGADQLRSKTQAASSAIADTTQRLGALDRSAGGIGGRVGSEFGQISNAAATAGANVQNTGTSLLSYATRIGAAVGALAIAAGAIISSISKSAADSTSALSDSSAKLGLSVQSYQALKKGADDAGISVEGLNRILGNIDKASTQAAGSLEKILPTDTAGRFTVVGTSLERIASGLAVAQQTADAFGRTADGTIDLIQKFGDTTIRVVNGVSKSTFDLAQSSNNLRQGAHAAADALAELGISADVLSKLTPDQRLELIRIQLDKIPDGAGKAALAAKLFGDEWRKALEFIQQLPNTLADSDGSLRAFSDSEIASGKKLRDSLSDLAAAFSFLKDKIGLLFAAGQTARADWLTKLIDQARQLVFGFIAADDAKNKLLKAGSFDFFKDFDLQAFKDFLNQKGETGLATAIGIIRDIALDLAKVWTSVLVPAGQLVIAGFNAIADAINATFGTDISGRFLIIVTVLGLVSGAFGLLGTALAPIGTLFGFLLSSFATLGPLLLGAGAIVRAFWAEFRLGGTAAITAVRTEQAGFLAGFAELARGNFTVAWDLFRTAGLAAFATLKSALSEMFGAGGSTFGAIRGLISGLSLAAAGLAAIFNAIFGTNIGTGGLLLVAIITQLTGGFGALVVAGRLLAALFTTIGAGLFVVIASAVILSRVFPDIGKSWTLVTDAFANLLAGDFSKAFQQLGQAFSGVWSNLQDQGVLTWAILGAGAIAVAGAVAGLIEKFKALSFLLTATAASVASIVAGLVAAGIIAADVSQGIDPAQKKIEEINSAFAKGQITLEEYNKRLQDLANSAGDAAAKTGDAAAKTGDTAQGFGETWKQALSKINEAMRGTAATSSETAGQVAAPWNQAAQQIQGGFKEIGKGVWQKIPDGARDAADQSAATMKALPGRVDGGFKEIGKGIWQKIPDGAKTAADQAAQTVNALPDKVKDVGARLQDEFNRFFGGDALPLGAVTQSGFSDSTWEHIKDAVTSNLQKADEALQAFQKASGDAAGSVQQSFAGLNDIRLPDWLNSALKNPGSLVTPPASGAANPFGDQLTKASSDADQLAAAAETAGTAVTAIGTDATAAAAGVTQLGQGAAAIDQNFGALGGSADTFAQRFEAAVSAIKSGSDGIGAALDGVIAKLQAAGDAARQLAQAAPAATAAADSAASSGDGSTPAPGFAAGGFTGNIGRSRIAGVVHGNEHVQPAWVVARPGVLGFLEMLRHSGDLAATISRFVGGFSMGGFVDGLSRSFSTAALPGYANGGLVAFNPEMAVARSGGLHPVTLDLGGGRQVGGLFAPPDVVEQLKRKVVLERMVTSGRRPGRGNF